MNSSTYTNLLCEIIDKHVVRVTINRPELLNAMDLPTMVELKTLLDEIGANRELRVLIITGAGDRSFVVGADRQEIRLHADDEERAKAFQNTSRDTFNFIEDLGKPSICAVNGFTFGLGVQLAIACTFRFASANARFGLPEINMGFFPSMGATQRLTRLIGESRATEMIFTGEPVDAAEAHRIGLVNRIVPLPELGSIVEGFAMNLAEKSPVAIRLASEAIRHGREMPLSEALKYEAKLSSECLKSEDSREGRRAFTEKRKPEFKGR